MREKKSRQIARLLTLFFVVGDYDIAIKFDDDHIPGSPFQVPVTTKDGKPKVDPRKVRAYGPGLEPENIFPGKPTSFVVDASDTGKFLS